MEGMYGISRAFDANGENALGSNSDLLDEIEISNDDGEVDNGDDDAVALADSEIMFPLEMSMSDRGKSTSSA
jgi:hypothetical protein